jgi:flagella basal body P-ring formation protein FlgA
MLVAAAVLAALVAECAEVTVSLKAKAEVEPDGGFVTVGEIAFVEGDEPDLARRVASVLVGAVPPSGEVRTIARAHVQARIRQEGLAHSEVAVAGERWVAVTAARASDAAGAHGADVFLADGLLRAVRAFVADEMGCPVDAIDAELLGLQWARRPEGPRSGECAVAKRTSGGPLGRSQYIVDVVAGAAGRALVWVEAVQYRTAVAARGDLSPQQVVGADDVVVVKIPVRDAAERPVSERARVVGRATDRRLAAGEPIGEGAIVDVPLVKKGQLVTVLVETPHCTITDQAEAENSGARGQVIRVQNLRSKRTFLARVIDRQMVTAVP